MSDLNNSNIIKNFSYDQNEILYNIMMLHNNGEAFECDMTASELKFYERSKEYFIPVPKILMDVFPQRDDIIKITPMEPLPLEDASIVQEPLELFKNIPSGKYAAMLLLSFISNAPLELYEPIPVKVSPCAS